MVNIDYWKIYYQKNKEKIKESSRKYKKENVEKDKIISFLWRIKNLDKCRIKEKERFEKYIKKHGKNHFNNLMRNNYIRNKDKQISRVLTYEIINKNPLIIDKLCHYCKKTKNLTIHHENYPTTTKEIKESIGKTIYYLCSDCHINKHSLSLNEISLRRLNVI